LSNSDLAAIALLIGAAFLDELIGIRELFGTALIMIGVYFADRRLLTAGK